jgi:hypothetical protein
MKIRWTSTDSISGLTPGDICLVKCEPNRTYYFVAHWRGDHFEDELEGMLHDVTGFVKIEEPKINNK